MDQLTIWHNPRCSKSRAALAILEASGQTFTTRHYLQDPPTRDELSALAAKLPQGVSGLLRKNESIAKEMGLGASTAEDALIAAMAEHPILIERPVIFSNDQAVIARPPELAQAFLSEGQK